jgi:uncharacterized membrane protein
MVRTAIRQSGRSAVQRRCLTSIDSSAIGWVNLVGKSLNLGVDKKLVQDVTETLKPGMSVLFVIGSGNPEVIIASSLDRNALSE